MGAKVFKSGKYNALKAENHPKSEVKFFEIPEHYLYKSEENVNLLLYKNANHFKSTPNLEVFDPKPMTKSDISKSCIQISTLKSESESESCEIVAQDDGYNTEDLDKELQALTDPDIQMLQGEAKKIAEEHLFDIVQHMKVIKKRIKQFDGKDGDPIRAKLDLYETDLHSIDSNKKVVMDLRTSLLNKIEEFRQTIADKEEKAKTAMAKEEDKVLPNKVYLKSIFEIFTKLTADLDVLKENIIDYYGTSQDNEYKDILDRLKTCGATVRSIDPKGDVRIVISKEEYEDYINRLITQFLKIVSDNERDFSLAKQKLSTLAKRNNRRKRSQIYFPEDNMDKQIESEGQQIEVEETSYSKSSTLELRYNADEENTPHLGMDEKIECEGEQIEVEETNYSNSSTIELGYDADEEKTPDLQDGQPSFLNQQIEEEHYAQIEYEEVNKLKAEAINESLIHIKPKTPVQNPSPKYQRQGSTFSRQLSMQTDTDEEFYDCFEEVPLEEEYNASNITVVESIPRNGFADIFGGSTRRSEDSDDDEAKDANDNVQVINEKIYYEIGKLKQDNANYFKAEDVSTLKEDSNESEQVLSNNNLNSPQINYIENTFNFIEIERREWFTGEDLFRILKSSSTHKSNADDFTLDLRILNEEIHPSTNIDNGKNEYIKYEDEERDESVQENFKLFRRSSSCEQIEVEDDNFETFSSSTLELQEAQIVNNSPAEDDTTDFKVDVNPLSFREPNIIEDEYFDQSPNFDNICEQMKMLKDEEFKDCQEKNEITTNKVENYYNDDFEEVDSKAVNIRDNKMELNDNEQILSNNNQQPNYIEETFNFIENERRLWFDNPFQNSVVIEPVDDDDWGECDDFEEHVIIVDEDKDDHNARSNNDFWNRKLSKIEEAHEEEEENLNHGHNIEVNDLCFRKLTEDGAYELIEGAEIKEEDTSYPRLEAIIEVNDLHFRKPEQDEETNKDNVATTILESGDVFGGALVEMLNGDQMYEIEESLYDVVKPNENEIKDCHINTHAKSADNYQTFLERNFANKFTGPQFGSSAKSQSKTDSVEDLLSEERDVVPELISAISTLDKSSQGQLNTVEECLEDIKLCIEDFEGSKKDEDYLSIYETLFNCMSILNKVKSSDVNIVQQKQEILTGIHKCMEDLDNKAS